MTSKKIILGLIFVVLLAPNLQENLNLFQISELRGFFVNTNKLNFSLKDWFEGVYQINQDKYLSENFGFRKTLVRLNNEYRFRLYRNSSNVEAVIGKNDLFYAIGYINTLNGRDFVGIDPIVQGSLKLKELQLLLKKEGILFVPIIAPNKARVYKESIPDHLYSPNYTNYDGFIKCFDKLNVSYIDFNACFQKLKNVSPYPFYGKYGVHWSYYGSTFATDSIIKYINAYSGTTIPLMDWKTNMDITDSLQHDDYDLGGGMNLLTEQLPSPKMAYPKIRLNDTARIKPSLLIIGDSYNHGIEQTDAPYRLFNNYKFFYYFREKKPIEDDPAVFYKLDMRKEIKDHQIILLLCTEVNLQHLGWGFVDRALRILKGESEEEDMKFNKIKILEFDIKKNEEWMKKIRREALLQNKNVDLVVYEQAKFLIEQEMNKGQLSLDEWKNVIKGNKDWMKQINDKCKHLNISVDSMIVLDALYMMSQKK